MSQSHPRTESVSAFVTLTPYFSSQDFRPNLVGVIIGQRMITGQSNVATVLFNGIGILSQQIIQLFDQVAEGIERREMKFLLMTDLNVHLER